MPSEDNGVLKPLRTWSHLASRKRRPTEYEVVSTNLIWSTKDPERPFCADPSVPLSQWYIEHRNRSPLRHGDWDGFRDPEQVTYRAYNLMRDGQEAYVDGLLDEHDRNDHDVGLEAEWIEVLAVLETPARYLTHAMQMSSAYLVAFAPASTISNCFMFQAGDHLRWLSRTAYRTARLGKNWPDVGFGAGERTHWEQHAAWQGFRELAERMLITWDWAEQFYVLNAVLQPAVEAACIDATADASRAWGDTLTALLAEARRIDLQRAARWTRALIDYAMPEPGNAEILEEWNARWLPLGSAAVSAYVDALPDGQAPAETATQRFRALVSATSLDLSTTA